MKRTVSDNSQDYNDAWENMNIQKNIQRQLIVDALRKAGFKNVRGSQGTWRYTSRRRLKLPVNLGIWKWVFALSPSGKSNIIVELDTIERDPVTKNTHSLNGRLSLVIIPVTETPEDSEWETTDAYYEWQRTHYGSESYDDPCFSQIVLPFNLPLSEDDRRNLADLIVARCENLEA